MQGLARHRARTALVFLLPVMVFFALMFFYPLVLELYSSLRSGVRTETYVGIENYRDALTDPIARNAFTNTLTFAFGVVTATVVGGLVLAVILTDRIRGRGLFRGILLVPYLTSIAIVGLLWRNILDPQVGILNRLLDYVGLPTQAWLNTSPVLVIIFIKVWQELGYVTLLFVAGIQGIPEVYDEAAEIDGANKRQRFRHITLPLLAPTTLFVTIVGVITSLQQFALPYLVTNGGPGNASDLYVFRVYQTAFSFRDFGYASALSYLLLFVILVLTIVQLRVGQRRSSV